MDLRILTNLLESFISTIPGIVGAIAIVIIGWIVAKIAAGIIRRMLVAVKIDALGDKLNEIEIVSNSNIKVVLSSLIAKVAYYFLLLIFWVAATDVLGVPAVSELMSNLINYVPQIISAVIVFAIGIFIAEFIKGIVLTACQSLGIPSAKLIAGFVFWFIFLTALVSALSQAGINTAFITSNLSVIIGGGVMAFALGYGLASKDMMANFLASFYSKDRFKLGDIIGIEGIKGTIIEIDNSSLTLQTDDKKVIIPLSKLTSEKIEVYEG